MKLIHAPIFASTASAPWVRRFLFERRVPPMAKRNRPDKDGSAKTSYEKAKKIIYASQSNCAICGRAVDFNRRFPDPWSATLDHIIPISKGGDPASLENLQLAHLQCNRIKANKLLQPQLKEKAVSNRDLPLSCDWANV